MSTFDRFFGWLSDRDDKPTAANSVFLVGLGRFGTAIAQKLVELDVEVMAIDTDQALVNEWSDKLTHVRVADATNPNTLAQLGIQNFDAAVVAIGSGIEASILATSALADAGVKTIWAKAITSEHGRILKRVGADEVVFPEKEMGERVAHSVTGQVVDYFQLDEGFVLSEMRTPEVLIGTTLGETNLRSAYNVTVVCQKPKGGVYSYTTSESVLGEGDLLLVAGGVKDSERFVDDVTS
jgi:trk system potassium uptake protein TrkA